MKMRTTSSATLALLMRWLVPAFIACTGFVAPSLAADTAPPGFTEIPATAETIARLRAGGYTLYLRHGYTDNSRSDRTPAVDLNDCTTQRPLNEEGRKLATEIGQSIRKAKIPITEIHASPLCRVRDTVAAAFPGRAPTIDDKLMYVANFTDEQKQPIIRNTRRLLSQPVANGSNRLIVAHAPNLMELLGYFPKEGTLVIFLPQGDDRFEYVASVSPSAWPALIRGQKATATPAR